jgi:hypothetical protein
MYKKKNTHTHNKNTFLYVNGNRGKM